MQPTPQLAEKISKKINQLMRKHQPKTQRELSESIGIPTAVLNRAINGTSTPAVEAIVKIAKYYGISTDELLGVDKKRPRRHKDSA